MFSIDPQTWSYMSLIFGILGFMLYAVTIFFLVTSISYAKYQLHHKPQTFLETEDMPGVSIIKPLFGIDPYLETNLESHFQIQYSKFELLFCFHDENDPGVTLVNKLIDKYTKVDAKIFIGGCDGIINPMVSNMLPAYKAATYDYIWISTSRILASTDIILDMVSKLEKPDVALVHQMPYVTDQYGLGGALEKIYFGCAMARYYLSINAIGVCCTTGMSYIFKKSILEMHYGLEYYGRYLAEDFFLTNKLNRAGYKQIISAYPAQQNVSCPTVAGFIARMVRWLRLRITMMTFVTCVVEPATECFPLGLWGAWCFKEYFGINPYMFMCFHVVIWIVRDYVQLSIVQNDDLPFSKFKFVIVWILREVLQMVILLIAMWKPREIKWGKETYFIQFGGNTKVKTDRTSISL